MTLFDNETNPAATAFIVGSDLSQLSVDDLHLCIAALKDEIMRIEQELERKVSGIKEADALFKF